MPSYDWPRLLAFTARKKPHKARLPGLVPGPAGRHPNGRRVWRFYLEGLFAN